MYELEVYCFYGHNAIIIFCHHCKVLQQIPETLASHHDGEKLVSVMVKHNIFGASLSDGKAKSIIDTRFIGGLTAVLPLWTLGFFYV